MPRYRTDDITGLTFNRLTAIKLLGVTKLYGFRVQVWEFKCTCGRTIAAPRKRIVEGRTKSCGCALSKKDAPFNQVYKIAKKDAIYRKYEWHLDKEQYHELAQQNCYYCGTPPSRVVYNLNKMYSYTCNGVDRVDNSKGYTQDNVVPCCSICNTAKSDLTVEAFFKQIEKIYLKHFAGEKELKNDRTARTGT